jgi:hypothetical protein
MEARIRSLVFEPARSGTLNVIVPACRVIGPGWEITAPAQLTRDEDRFRFELHFNSVKPPAELARNGKSVFTSDDHLKLEGKINGETFFRCSDIFPPVESFSSSGGTSRVKCYSKRLEIVPEGSDLETTDQIREALGEPPVDPVKPKSFSAHLVYDGPKLIQKGSRTTVTTQNDFLGEATASSMDTHSLAGDGWEAAMIQKDSEVHLHLRATQQTLITSGKDLAELIECINIAVGFVLGCNPWACYREIRFDHIVFERWLSPHFMLSTTFMVPVSAAMNAHFRSDPKNEVHAIIAAIADGLRRFDSETREKLAVLLWHFRGATHKELPSSLKLLTHCAVLDGLIKLIAGYRSHNEDAPTTKAWAKAHAALGLPWDKDANPLFNELFGKHRHVLAHGWLWRDETTPVGEIFEDLAGLGMGFIFLVAAYCGYRGPILVDPYRNKMTVISSKMSAPPSA